MTRREAQELVAEMLKEREYMRVLMDLHKALDAESPLGAQAYAEATAKYRRASELQYRIISAMCGE